MPAQARLGDRASADADAHGCLACPHPVKGPAVGGSADVNINGRPATRVGDAGIHTSCCAGNTWNADSGAGSVFINGKAAMRVGDATRHCGGRGSIIEGSPDVFVGDDHPSARPASQGPSFVGIVLRDQDGNAVSGVRYRLTLPGGRIQEGRTDSDGRARVEGIDPGDCEVSFPTLPDHAWRRE